MPKLGASPSWPFLLRLAPQELSPGLGGAQAADPRSSRRVGIQGSVLAPGNYLYFQKRLSQSWHYGWEGASGVRGMGIPSGMCWEEA